MKVSYRSQNFHSKPDVKETLSPLVKCEKNIPADDDYAWVPLFEYYGDDPIKKEVSGDDPSKRFPF